MTQDLKITVCTSPYDLAKAFNEDYDKRQEDVVPAFDLGVVIGLERALATVKGMQEDACKRRDILRLKVLDDVEDALNDQLDIFEQND